MAKAFLWFTPSLFFYVADLWSVFDDSDLKMVGEFLFVISGVIINVNAIILFKNSIFYITKILDSPKNGYVFVVGRQIEGSSWYGRLQYDPSLYEHCRRRTYTSEIYKNCKVMGDLLVNIIFILNCKFQNHNQYTSAKLRLCVHRFACFAVFDKFYTTHVVFAIEISIIRTKVCFKIKVHEIRICESYLFWLPVIHHILVMTFIFC